MNADLPTPALIPKGPEGLDAGFRAVLLRATPPDIPADFAQRMQLRVDRSEPESRVETWTQRILLAVLGGGALLYGAAPVAEAVGSALQPVLDGLPWAPAAGLAAALAWSLDQWWSRRGGLHPI